MGDKFVTEELFEEAMNGLVSKEKFQSDIDCLVSGLTDVNKAITTLTTQLKEHIKKQTSTPAPSARRPAA
jgi:hypothetical protein